MRAAVSRVCFRSTARRLLLAGACGLLLAGCGEGDYSNEDVDFQTSVPDGQSLAVPPIGPEPTPASPEYYGTTVSVVGKLNAVVDAVLALLDRVRVSPPSRRAPGERTWGPFPAERAPGWSARVILARQVSAAGVLSFAYRFELRPDAAPDDAWLPLLTGTAQPAGSLRRGLGDFQITTTDLRAAGFPIDDPANPDDLNDIATLSARYDSASLPRAVHLDTRNIAGVSPERAVYDFTGAAGAGGQMTFAVDGAPQSFSLTSRWTTGGAGRADLTLTSGPGAGLAAVNCWTETASASYTHYPWDETRTAGSATACAFPGP